MREVMQSSIFPKTMGPMSPLPSRLFASFAVKKSYRKGREGDTAVRNFSSQLKTVSLSRTSHYTWPPAHRHRM